MQINEKPQPVCLPNEYVLSQKKWDEIQARIEKLEALKHAVDHRLEEAWLDTADSFDTPQDALDALIKREIELDLTSVVNALEAAQGIMDQLVDQSKHAKRKASIAVAYTKDLEARTEELEAKIFHMSEQGAKNDPLTWRRNRR